MMTQSRMKVKIKIYQIEDQQYVGCLRIFFDMSKI